MNIWCYTFCYVVFRRQGWVGGGGGLTTTQLDGGVLKLFDYTN